MTAFFTVILRAALIFFGYLGVQYACSWLLPLSSAGYTLCANLLVCGVSAVLCAVRRDLLRVTGLRRISIAQLLSSIGAGIGGCLIVRLMMLTVPFPEAWMQSYTERVDIVQQAPAWVMYLSTLVVAPLAEELVFRGMIYHSLKQGMPRAVAALIVSAVFAALHGTAMWACYTFLLSLLLIWLLERTGSLWACIACHAAFNFVGQLPLVGILPDAVVVAVFAAGAIAFVLSLWCLERQCRAVP